MSNLSFDFSGKVILVTGAAQGIGLALSKFFRVAGGSVAMVDFDHGALEQSAGDLGGVLRIAADVTVSAQVEAAVMRVLDTWGRVDVLVNNAGILRDRMLWNLSDQEWGQVIEVHMGGTFKFTRACVPHFREQSRGRIVNVTSYSGIRGNPGQANYASAKSGIIGFTKTAAKELARFGITVNAISPNATTRMVASIPEDRLAELRSQIPLGRFGDPEEMAAAVGFLASDEAAYITGVILPVDGGIAI